MFDYLVKTTKPGELRGFPGLFALSQEILSVFAASARLPGGWILPLERILRQLKFKCFPVVRRSRKRMFIPCPPSFCAQLGTIVFFNIS